MAKVFKHLYNVETAGPAEGEVWPISRAELDAIEARYNQPCKRPTLGPKGDPKKLARPCVFDGKATSNGGESNPNMTFMTPCAPTGPELTSEGALWLYYQRVVCGLGGSYKTFSFKGAKTVKVTRMGLGGGRKPQSFSEWLASGSVSLSVFNPGMVHGCKFKKS